MEAAPPSSGQPASPALSGEQQQAVDPGVHAWVSASAGTGKTHVLVGRVLRLMLAGADPAGILCLTYTRAAAAEMRNRLLDRLRRLAACGPEALADELATLLARKPTAEECSRARRLFLQVLELPEGLRIETMHAFCQSLLARFPLEAGLAPHFRVADEAEARLAFDEAMNELFATSTQDPRLANALGELATQFPDGDLTWRLHQAVGARHRLAEALAGRGIDGHMAALGRLLDLEDGHPDETALLARFLAQEALDDTRLAQWAQRLTAGGKILQNCAEAIRIFLAHSPERPDERLAAYKRIFLTREDARNRRLQQQLAKNHPEIAGIWEEACDRLLAFLAQKKAVSIWRLTRAFLIVAQQLIQFYEAIKTAQGMLDFADLIARTEALLGTPGIAPWVLYKLDRRIAHILVDEAQDSNSRQWALIAALLEETFSGRGGREEEPGTLFAVGDVKQSIYRFQGAEPESFISAREDFRERAAAVRQSFRSLSLSTSFRSAPEILTFVDAVFAGDTGRALLGLGQEPISHQAHRQDAPGLVELWAAEAPAEGDANPTDGAAYELPQGITRVDDPADRLAARIADRIARMLGEGELLESENRPIRAGDILVLVRRREAFVDKLMSALRARGVPVAGLDRLVITDSLAVQDLMAAARFALLPEDDLNLAALLKSPLCGLNDEDLLAFAPQREASLWQALRRWAEETGHAELRSRLESWLEMADCEPPASFFSRILFAQGGFARLIRRLGPDILDPITEFLARAHQFGERGPASLQHFLQWLARQRQEIKRDLEEGRDEVRIMTIHGAKGLEAPIVFVPETCSVPKADQDRGLLWIDSAPEDLSGLPLLAVVPRSRKALPARLEALDAERIAREREEYWRLLYVALTRARDRLYLCGWSRSRPAPGCWYERLEEAMRSLLDLADEEEWTVLRYPADRLPRTAEEGRRQAAITKQDSIVPASWMRTPPPPEAGSRRVLSPSRAEYEEDAPDAMPPFSPRTGGGDGITRGRLLHSLLQHLPALPPEERQPAAERFLNQQGERLPAAERESILAETMAVLTDPAFAPLFSPEAKAEVPITGMLAGRPVAGRIDRLLITDERILLVDYKSLRPAPRTADQVPGAYLRQMALYHALLRQAFPDRPVEAALLWTAVPRLMPLPESLLTAAAPSWLSAAQG